MVDESWKQLVKVMVRGARGTELDMDIKGSELTCDNE
jgi:hypothetical protein